LSVIWILNFFVLWLHFPLYFRQRYISEYLDVELNSHESVINYTDMKEKRFFSSLECD
jgi:hypothetical protein